METYGVKLDIKLLGFFKIISNRSIPSKKSMFSLKLFLIGFSNIRFLKTPLKNFYIICFTPHAPRVELKSIFAAYCSTHRCKFQVEAYFIKNKISSYFSFKGI